MPYVPPGFAQCNFRMLLSGDPEPMMVTWGIKFDDILTADFTEIANDLKDVFYAEWGDRIPSSYSLQGVTMYVKTGDGPVVYESTGGSTAFPNAAAAVPQNVAYLIKKQTARSGRQGRGRMYIPGVSDSNVDEKGSISSENVGFLQATATAFLTGVNAVAGVEHSVLLHTSNLEVPDVITGLVADSRVATQRRRLR